MRKDTDTRWRTVGNPLPAGLAPTAAEAAAMLCRRTGEPDPFANGYAMQQPSTNDLRWVGPAPKNRIVRVYSHDRGMEWVLQVLVKPPKPAPVAIDIPGRQTRRPNPTAGASEA